MLLESCSYGVKTVFRSNDPALRNQVWTKQQTEKKLYSSMYYTFV